MIYLYDNAIASDLQSSFNTDIVGCPCVKVVDPEQGLSVVAQKANDHLEFPLVLLTRYPDTPIDKDRMNFTRAHRGVAAVVDKDTNELYYEKVIPIQLNYDLTILATNTADREEMMRELIFKYNDMYFVTLELPYECKRKVRFGIRVDPDKDISNKSGVIEYLGGGTLYQCVIPLKCEGCVLVSYTSSKLQRSMYDIEPVTKGETKP